MIPAFIATLWLGIVLGVSLLATPIELTSSSLELATALEVGRATFRLLAGAQWMLAAAFAVSVWVTKQRWPWTFALVLAVLALESVWLLPALGARADEMRAGAGVSPSPLHAIFVATVVVQWAALVHIAVVTARSRARG